MAVGGCEKRHTIECDATGRRPWSIRFRLRLLAARRGYRREARYGDHGVVACPCRVSQSVTPIEPTHEPTGRAMGPLGSPVSVALPVKLAYMGVPWRVQKSVRLGKYFRTSLYIRSLLTRCRSPPCVGCEGCPGRPQGAPSLAMTTSMSRSSLTLFYRT